MSEGGSRCCTHICLHSWRLENGKRCISVTSGAFDFVSVRILDSIFTKGKILLPYFNDNRDTPVDSCLSRVSIP